MTDQLGKNFGMITIPKYAYDAFVRIVFLTRERQELKDSLYAKEKEISEMLHKLKPGAVLEEKQ